MVATLFPFVDSIIELSEDQTCFVLVVETLLDSMPKVGRNKAVSVPEGEKVHLPPDVVLSLLRPDEFTKLQKYLAFYQEKYGPP
jgi:hypothetical protein